MQDLLHKFWYAEKYFNQFLLEENMEKDDEYYSFKAFLNVKIFVYPISFMTVNNLFLLHFAFPPFKLAINYHLNKFVCSQRNQPSERQKLA